MWEIGEPGLVVRGRAYPQLGLIHDKEQRRCHCQQCSLLPLRSLGMELAASVHVCLLQHFSRDTSQSTRPSSALY